ncbi:hypothetical protein D3C72_1608540 [compost metagenome]
MAAGQWSLDDDEVRQAVQLGVLAQENLQGADGRDDDAQLGIAETRMVGHQGKRAKVQAGGQGDAVDAGVECRVQAHAQGFARAVHGQLFHAIDEDQAIAFFGFHGTANMQALRFRQASQVELHHSLVAVVDVEFVQFRLVFDESGVETAIRHVFHHGIGNMPDTVQPGRFQGQLRRGNIHTHSAYHDGHIFFFAKSQAEIINTFHCYP